MLFHPIVNVDINKALCLRKYEHKASDFKSQKLVELANDSTNWSGKVLAVVSEIILKHNLNRLDSDILIKLFSSSKTMHLELGKNISQFDRNTLTKITKEQLNTDNNSNTVSETNEVYLGLNGEYSEVDDITLAQMIILLSKLARQTDKIWTSTTLQLKEFPKAIFYFRPEDGNIILSARSFNRAGKAIEHPELNEYIKAMNDLINGKRAIPGVV